MSINLSVPQATELKPRITVFGVGGAGGNAVNNMIESGLEGVDFVVANTDSQALSMAAAERRIQLGASITEGLGAGSRPEVGCAAAEEALSEIVDNLAGSHMVFITAGMGGGTGTGGAPVIARAAREAGILTVGVVTKPFQFEGTRRARIADEGIAELHKYVDTLIIIPNQNLFRVANERTTFADAFSMADEVLHSGVAGITDLMIKPGLINLDFADVRTVMNEMGKAMMGTGEAEGEKRAIEAAEAAISNPLLDEVSMKGARGVLINITGGMDLTLYEVDEAANRIRSEVDPDANIIVGSTFDPHLDGKMRVSVVATGIEADELSEGRPAVGRTALPHVGEPVVEAPVAQAAPVQEELTAFVEPAAPAQVDAPVITQEAAPVHFEETPAVYEAPVAQTPAPVMQGEASFDPSSIDPREFEAEVIIHKPVDQVEQAASRTPYIPASLDRVESQSAQPAAQRAQPPKRGPSFFERLTGARKNEREVAPQVQARPVQAQQAPAPRAPVRQEPAFAAPRPPAISPDAVRTAPSVQQRVASQPTPSVSSAPAATAPQQESLVQTSLEEDQLEIPTFLRRQAN